MDPIVEREVGGSVVGGEMGLGETGEDDGDLVGVLVGSIETEGISVG